MAKGRHSILSVPDNQAAGTPPGTKSRAHLLLLADVRGCGGHVVGIQASWVKALEFGQAPELGLTSSCWLVCGVVVGIQASWRVEGSCVLLPTLCHAGSCGLVTISLPLTKPTQSSREQAELTADVEGEAVLDSLHCPDARFSGES